MDEPRKTHRRKQAQERDEALRREQEAREQKEFLVKRRKECLPCGLTAFLSRFRQALSRVQPEQIRLALIVIFALVTGYCFFQAAGIIFRSQNTKYMEAELSRLKQFAASEPEQAAGADEIPMEMPIPQMPLLTAEPDKIPYSSAFYPAESPRQIIRTMSESADVSFHRVNGDPLPQMALMHERNYDLKAWIKIDGVLDLPIVYKDNEYYLTHDFDKQKSASGTLFLDENHPLTSSAQNLLIHGHNMKDGTMFGRLTQYVSSIDYLKKHPFVDLDTLWETERYVIFSVMVISLNLEDDSFLDYYNHAVFGTDSAFESYVRKLQLGSMYGIPISVQPGDTLLTLSTCMGDQRLVIVARRIREGESISGLRQNIALSFRANHP